MKNEDMINSIKQLWRPSDKRSGRLVHHHSGVLHYSVTLSNEKAICWGGLETGSKGGLVIHDIWDHHQDAQWVKHLSLEQIKRNVLGSVTAFHNGVWDYNFFGWNCEHWARLVTTGEPISYQMRDWPGWLIDLFTGGKLHWRGDAIPHLAAHVAMLA